jgi:DNA-binding response OmpR family regulator
MAQVLIVEDDTFLQGLAAGRLQKEGHEVAVASNGVEADGKLAEGAYDVILLDLMLPEKDGFAVLEDMRKGGNNAPVVVFSNMADEAEIKRAMDLGANEYMIKANFTLDEVAAKVAEFTK